MTQSAIWKIENGSPRRRITVDETVAFSRVFDIKLATLMLPASREAQALWEQRGRLMERAIAIFDEVDKLETRILELTATDDGTVVMEVLTATFGDDPAELVRGRQSIAEWHRQRLERARGSE